MPDLMLDYAITGTITEPRFIPFPGLGKEWRLQMSTARGLTDRRIYDIPDVSDMGKS
ncbi:MAG: hypothetical protein M1511_09485 [Deltaproteobacteria bacterium]|nr:hypothetical protein [Deltaproteobacteria bacterium]